MDDKAPPSLSSSLLDYLRLFRVTNVFTAVADVAMGYLCARATLQPWPIFAWLVFCSALLYTAGMILNDVFDVAEDARLRPERPLPSGRIPVARARRLGFALLLAGVAGGWAAGLIPAAGVDSSWRTGAVATVLAVAVLLYDSLLKRTPLGPPAMGACRFLNVLLGASVGVAATGGASWVGFLPHQLAAAGGIGIYVTGVTWFARREAQQSSRWQLVAAALVMAAGIAVLGLVHRLLPPAFRPGLHLQSETVWLVLLALLGFTILRRAAVAIASPGPKTVQTAVRVAILSIIVLDAAVVLEVSHWFYAVGLLTLLVPTVLLGRWISAT
jgi:4-hydroxybenzoate polyprenyltransferase